MDEDKTTDVTTLNPAKTVLVIDSEHQISQFSAQGSKTKEKPVYVCFSVAMGLVAAAAAGAGVAVPLVLVLKASASSTFVAAAGSAFLVGLGVGYGVHQCQKRREKNQTVTFKTSADSTADHYTSL